MNVGDLVRIDRSTRKNGHYAGKLGLIVGVDIWGGHMVSVDGEVKKFHTTQIASAVDENR